MLLFLNDEFQPTLMFPSMTCWQISKAPQLGDWFKQLPPYFWDATLNGVQDVESKENGEWNIKFGIVLKEMWMNDKTKKFDSCLIT